MTEAPGPGTSPRGAIGGAGGDAGVEYRRAVAAYAVAHGLAGVALDGFGVPPDAATVSTVAIETDNVVDDVSIEFESGWRVAVQAKINLSKGKPFRSAIAQWRRAAEQGLAAKERLVLVTSSMPKWMHDLKRYLERYKSDRPGSPTKAERLALSNLENELSGLGRDQIDKLLKSAVIHVLDVVEEGNLSSREAIRLLDPVVGKESSTCAWRDLVTLAGVTARMRGGFRLQGWLSLLTSRGKYTILDSRDTVAAEIVQNKQALDRYYDIVRHRGRYIDLRPLGATIPPIPLDRADAEIKVRALDEDGQRGRDLLWTFMRRGRVVLTGLPGGGKSFALSRLAAQLLDVPGAPLPVVVSLREVERRDHADGFRERLLRTAVKDLRAYDQSMIRAELERRFIGGGVALLLDSLDETHERRAQVVSEIDQFVKSISSDVDVLVATRDVAYGYAATLGWPDLRLESPHEVTRMVEAILQRYAEENSDDSGHWVKTRQRWVAAALARDRTLKETPLLPILLSLLAASKDKEALPEHRASILYAVVKSIVERQAKGRGIAFKIGGLSGDLASKALLDGFANEATVIAANGGQCRLDLLIPRLAKTLRKRWDLAKGPAEVTAELIVRFWDETGIFVMSGASELVVPRVELFVEIGEAVSFSRRKRQKVIGWVTEAAEAGRLEPLILAAGLSETVTTHLLHIAATTRNYDLLASGLTALRQQAKATEPELSAFVGAALEDMRHGDQEAWRLWSNAIEIPAFRRATPALLEVTRRFPVEYQTIARVVLLLHGAIAESPVVRERQLLEALRLRRPPKLPTRFPPPENKFNLGLVDHLYDEAVIGAAAELVGTSDAADSLVINALEHGSLGMQERLLDILHQHGRAHLADRYLQGLNARFRKALSPLTSLDPHTHEKLLGDLSAYPPTVLTYQQQTRLDELADFCETLNLNDISTWPEANEYNEWFLSLANLVQRLGAFDVNILSAQAALTLERIEALETQDPFTFIFDCAQVRTLNAWNDVESQDDAVRFLVTVFFKRRGAAWVAARALGRTPKVDLAMSLLSETLPALRGSPEHERIAGVTMLMLTNGALVDDWVSDQDPVLRALAAKYMTMYSGESLRPEVITLLRDVDGYVVEAMLDRLTDIADEEIRPEIERIAREPNPRWMCLHCRTVNGSDRRSCTGCIYAGPDVKSTAKALLTCGSGRG